MSQNNGRQGYILKWPNDGGLRPSILTQDKMGVRRQYPKEFNMHVALNDRNKGRHKSWWMIQR